MSRAHAEHPVWLEVSPEIKPGEFSHPYMMDADFLRTLSKIRRTSGVPFRFVSDHRSPDRNVMAGGVTGSAHTELPCRAVDIRVHNSYERFAILRAALVQGITRIGIYPPNEDQREAWGKNSGSLHLDASDEKPANVAWVSV